MLRKLLAVLAIVLLSAIPASAGPGSLVFVEQFRVIHQPVGSQTWCIDCVGVDYTTQEPWVVNPTQNPWDVDDRVRWVANSASLDPGQSASASTGLIADSSEHLVGVQIDSPSSALVVTAHYDPQNVTFTLTARPNGNAWRYQGCVVGPRYSGSGVPEAQIIPDSHGGWGVPSTVTVTVSNPTNRRVRSTSGLVGLDLNAPGTFLQTLCVGEKTPVFALNGALWRTAI